MKKTAVLCAFNSKYIHTSLAVRYIKAYADKHCSEINCIISEQTVNILPAEAVNEILVLQPDIAAFSCYIWNIDFVLDVAREVKKASPDTTIILGGPEVSFNPESYINISCVDYVQCGDGEKGMAYLFDCIAKGEIPDSVYGICFKKDGASFICAPYTEKNLCEIESPYTDEYSYAVNGRIAYIESTRGCPFSCAFCLSGTGSGIRYFPKEQIEMAVLKLWQSGAKTIKFIDRTFNANVIHANSIISFIEENYNKMPKDVCFHFEIAADILSDSTIELLEKAPVGLFQIEAGLQSFNKHTLDAVMRKTDTDKISENVKKIVSARNIHTHIDLIAGLPFEDISSFKESFNKAFSIGADMLQLGFLKLLYGSRLRDESEKYDIVYSSEAPYEIIATKWLGEDDVEVLHKVEDANEKISNSHRFSSALKYVLDVSCINPFDLFLGFGKRESMPLDEYTAEVFEYFLKLPGVDKEVLRDKMCVDRLMSNSSGKFPECLKIYDKRLAFITYSLEQNPETAPKKNMKRAVCILYSENMVVYSDYPSNKSQSGFVPALKYIPLYKFITEEMS